MIIQIRTTNKCIWFIMLCDVVVTYFLSLSGYTIFGLSFVSDKLMQRTNERKEELNLLSSILMRTPAATKLKRLMNLHFDLNEGGTYPKVKK